MHSLNNFVAACVVWYKPSAVCSVVNNVLSYSDFVGKVYIVDNSDTDNSALADAISNAVYINLMTNTGIANALNVGLEKALTDGFEWCMTMDQDSRWEEKEIIKYLNHIPRLENSKIKNLFPKIFRPVSYSAIDILVRKVVKKNETYETIVQQDDRWITSGNIVNLKVWKSLGEFNKLLFIDEVDFDYCARYSETMYESLSCNDVILNHQIGNSQVLQIFGKKNPRLFYQIRNRIYIMRKYPKYAKKYSYNVYEIAKFTLKQILISGSLSEFVKRCKIARAAIRAAYQI